MYICVCTTGEKRRRGKMVANPALHRVGGTCIIISFSFSFLLFIYLVFLLIFFFFFWVWGEGSLGYGRLKGENNYKFIGDRKIHTHKAIRFGGGAPGVIESEGVRNRTERQKEKRRDEGW